MAVFGRDEERVAVVVCVRSIEPSVRGTAKILIFGSFFANIFPTTIEVAKG